jgi:hypothetical protein
MDQLVDVTPHHPIASFLAKFFTVAMMQIVMLALIMIVGIGAQIGMGFFRFEPGQYLFQLLMIDLPVMLTYSLAAFFFAVLMPNKYAGYLAMILFYALFMITPGLSLDHRLIIFNSAGGVEYSEMNGYGDYLPRFFIFRLYWGLFVFILTMIAVKFWPRGVETRIRERWHHIRQAGFDGQWKATTVMAAGFILTGGFIFYNTNILNEYHTSRYQEKAQIRFEKAFKRYENMAQPRITEVDLRVDMYPSPRRQWILLAGEPHHAGHRHAVYRLLHRCETDPHRLWASGNHHEGRQGIRSTSVSPFRASRTRRLPEDDLQRRLSKPRFHQ